MRRHDATAEYWEGTGYVTIAVIDSGRGMDPKTAAKAFEAFFTTYESGLGMGLAVTKHLLEANGGSVEIDDRHPGPGCRVAIALPRVS